MMAGLRLVRIGNISFRLSDWDLLLGEMALAGMTRCRAYRYKNQGRDSEILERAESGSTCSEIAKEFGRTSSRIRQILRPAARLQAVQEEEAP